MTRSAGKRKVHLGLAATLMIVFSLVATGGALAAFSIGSFTNTFNQTAATQTPGGAPTGVTLLDSEAAVAGNALGGSVAGDCASTNLGTSGSPTALTAGAYTYICLNAPNTIAAADYVWTAEVTFSTSASTSTTYNIQESIGSTVFMVYVKTPASLSGTTTVDLVYDLTFASVTSVSLVNVEITQCSGSTCQ